MNAIEAQYLRRTFVTYRGYIRRERIEIVAVDGITFSVEPGELFGMLGPNGAGKTTTIKMLTTLLVPTSGSARVLGHDLLDVNAIRGRISCIFGGERGLYWRLSGRDNLRYFADLYGVAPQTREKRIPELLALVGLSDRAEDRVETYSLGMKQRLHLARGLLHDPEILFMDEPTLGLDPVGAREVRELIKGLAKEQQRTIFLTTHYLLEAENLCDRIAIINHGKLVTLDTPQALKRLVSDLDTIEIELYGVAEEALAALGALPGLTILGVETRELVQVLKLHAEAGTEAIPTILQHLNSAQVGKITTRQSTLEDAYIRLIGRES